MHNFSSLLNITLHVSDWSFRPSSGVLDCAYTVRYMSYRFCWLLASGNEMERS